MENQFGQSFAHVRVHTDDSAAASAAAIRARAYTVGSHIVFGSGHFSPESDTGQRLLAHELAHVVQQMGAPAGVVQRAPWNDYFEPADWGNGGDNGGFFPNPFAPAPQGGDSEPKPFFSVNAERPNDDTTTGHAWVALDDGKGKHKAWGFYAACVPVCSTMEYLEIAAGKWVPGDVHDDSFARPTDQGIYFISQAKYESAMQLMEQSDPTLYNLWEYNCVDYARTMAQLFGITIPDFPGIDEPEELGDWIASGERGR